jgi:hypothetical protein
MTAHFTLSARNSDDAQLVKAIADADHGAFEALMRRHNGKLFRIARAILMPNVSRLEALARGFFVSAVC